MEPADPRIAIAGTPHTCPGGGVVVLRPVPEIGPGGDDAGDVDAAEDVEQSVADDALRSVLLDIFEIGPPLVDPRDHVEPTWVAELADGSVEVLELVEALMRVHPGDRHLLVAEHLAVLDTMTAHWAVCRAASDGLLSAADVDWSLMCSLCVVDTESHAYSLSQAIAFRSAELFDALRVHGRSVLAEAQRI